MERYRRCWHCQSKYLCLISGERGYHTNHDNDRYCEVCDAVIRAALAEIPRKFEKDWVPTEAVTLEQVLAWKRLDDEARSKARAEGKFVGERITSPLFDLTGKRRERNGIVYGKDGFKGRTFEFRYWVTPDDDTPTDVTLREEVERNLVTGELLPWRRARART
jgi:hypothetical protein